MTGRHSRRVTIAEVALAAGVSKTTVSVVLNGVADSVGIAEATRAAVLQASARLGYRANRAARALRRQRSEVLTLLVQDLGNPWFIDMAVAARAAAEARGYTLNVVGAGPLEAELQALEALGGGGSDGVLVATGRHGARGAAILVLRDLVGRGVPAVVLLDRSPDAAIPAIRVDVEDGAYTATRHLLGLGHQRVAHLALERPGPIEEDESSQGDRYRGYVRALREAGIEPAAAWLVRGPDTLAGGARMVAELLERPGPRPTAALVYNDLTAFGALHGLREAGLRVPEDMAVVGTDGIEHGRYTAPPLTTVAHPAEELGRLGIETLFALLAGGAPPEQERMLPTRLVVRRSSGA
jgi:DNA-binding LacI/PurR family transcriptional regulator